MESLYYIPSIEEFRVGFEYEDWNNYRKEWNKNILTKKDLEALGSFMYHFLEAFESNYIRVKYLDKSDIESLGFKEDKVNNYFVKESLFHGEKVILKIFLSRTSTTISLINIDRRKYDDFIPNIEYPVEFYEVNDLFLFVGEIKNKSELEVLLKQLNING